MSPAPSLIRSGWWVAVAAGVLIAGMLVLALEFGRRPGSEQLGDGHSVSSYGFELSPSLVSEGQIVAAGMPRDGVLALQKPTTLSVAEVDAANHEGRGKFLLPHDRVLGIEIDGEARAYPLRLLRWHEVVNDRIAEHDVLVSYNPLCDSAVASDRRWNGETLTFGVSGLVLNSNMLLYDRRSDPTLSSLWSQLDARAVAGPLAGAEARLTRLPAAIATWEQWLLAHPDTRILAPVARLASLYKRDPYSSYFGSSLLRFPVDPLPPERGLSLKDRIVIVTSAGRETPFALRRIAHADGRDRGEWETSAAGVPLLIHYDLEVGAALVEPLAEPGPGFATRQAFWFAWYAAHPDAPPPLPPG